MVPDLIQAVSYFKMPYRRLYSMANIVAICSWSSVAWRCASSPGMAAY